MIEIDRTDCELKMSQCKYAMDLLEKYNMKDCKPASTPTSFNRKWKATNDSPLFQNPEKFRSVLGALQYLTTMRPDICYVVTKFLSICMHLLLTI